MMMNGRITICHRTQLEVEVGGVERLGLPGSPSIALSLSVGGWGHRR